uniref:PRKR-interacting protein 1 homolog n=1 Tax=Sinocyclocheilus grahami TaxID=75366 RepID=A0A672QW36_SINGR
MAGKRSCLVRLTGTRMSQKRDVNSYPDGYRVLNSSELRELLQDEEKMNQIVRLSEKFQELQLERETLLVTNRNLAEESLSSRPHLQNGKRQLAAKYEELAKLTAACREKQSRLGSSAGAGSGEFHVYRHLRRREYQRQDFLERISDKQKLDEEYIEKVKENQKAAEERTAKRRKKREKLKQKKLMAKKAKMESQKEGGSEEKSSSSASEEEEQEDDAEVPSFIMGKR